MSQTFGYVDHLAGKFAHRNPFGDIRERTVRRRTKLHTFTIKIFHEFRVERCFPGSGSASMLKRCSAPASTHHDKVRRFRLEQMGKIEHMKRAFLDNWHVKQRELQQMSHLLISILSKNFTELTAEAWTPSTTLLPCRKF